MLKKFSNKTYHKSKAVKIIGIIDKRTPSFISCAKNILAKVVLVISVLIINIY